MLKIAICDDEKEFRDRVLYMLKQYMESKNIHFEADTFQVPSDLAGATENGIVYDIYLLDIYMPGITWMSIATELRSRDVKSPIIFLTSSADHALEAFGVDATHYLLKPYSKEQFAVGMDKAMQSITSHWDSSIVLKVDNELRNSSTSRILYCQTEDKYQRLYLKDDERLLVRISGAELYKQLAELECFYRCGRAHIINLNMISRVTHDGETEKIIEYLNFQNDYLESRTTGRFCENETVNNILNVFQKKAAEANIAIEIRAAAKPDISVPAPALVTVVANILESALHGALESKAPQPTIQVSIKHKADRLVIRCENTCLASLNFEEMPEHLQGTGIRSVISTAENYNGSCRFSASDGVFRCTVIMDE